MEEEVEGLILRVRSGNSVFQKEQGRYTQELIEIVTARTRPAQVETRQHPSTGKGKWAQSPTFCCL